MKARQDIHNSGVPVVCRACEARHGGLCGALTPEQLTELSKYTAMRDIPAGSPLYADADQVTSYSNILSGVVKLSKIMADGRQQIVGLQFAPDFLGRPFQRTRNLDAEAATEITVCSFPKSALERLMKDAPGLEHKLLGQTLRELDEAREWMVTLGRKTASERVASFLLLIARNSNPERLDLDGPVEFELPLSRSDIADFLGLTIETVSRQITRLRKDGIIDLPGYRRVSVADPARLERRTGTM